MNEIKKQHYKYSWEEAIEILRSDPEQQGMIFNSYLTDNLLENCKRFFTSAEFNAVKKLFDQYAPGKRVLDMPAGNGIATYAFAKSGFDVVAVDPNPSEKVGRGAVGTVLNMDGLHAEIVDAYGENLPFPSKSFDAVYVRQGLHHAANLPSMLKEIERVLRPGGILLACREHVVDNYKESLQSFLLNQADHQLYGGENAFTLQDYKSAIERAGLIIKNEIGPFDSVINLFPNTKASIDNAILTSYSGRFLRVFIKDQIVIKIGVWWANRRKTPGRLYSFLVIKPAF